MTVAIRVGRGAWVTGGGGLLTVWLAGAAVKFVLMAVAATACLAALALFVLARYWLTTSRALRMSLLAEALRGCVEQDSDEALISASSPMWAVYAVGADFYYGRYPTKEAALVQEYPSQLGYIARVAAFPDAAHASRAAARLRRHGFSFQELRRLFPDNYRSAALRR